MKLKAYRKVSDFYYSIGVTIDSNGRIVDVLWNSPAFKAGLSQGFTVIAINGKSYKPELLKSAIGATGRGLKTKAFPYGLAGGGASSLGTKRAKRI
jgi:predicted metalloprotease with PDZ domain